MKNTFLSRYWVLFAGVGILLITSLVVLYLSGVIFPKQDESGFNEKITSANLMYEKKEYANALKTYQEAVELYPNRSESYAGMVKVLIDKNLVQKASEIADIYMSKVGEGNQSPELAEIYYLIGRKYEIDSSVDNAQKYYLLADKHDPLQSQYRNSIAHTYLLKGDINNAINYLDVSVGANNQYFDAVLMRTFTYLTDTTKSTEEIAKLDSYDLANYPSAEVVKSYKDALNSISKVSGDFLYRDTYIARELLNSGYHKLALRVLEGNIEKMGEYWDGLYFLGRAFFEDGNYDKAIETINSAILISPQAPECYVVLARSYAQKNDMAKAQENYDKAVKYSKTTVKTDILKEYYNYSILKDQSAKAISVLNTMESIQDSVWLRLAYCRTYLLNKDFDKMKIHLDKLTENDKLSTDEKTEYLELMAKYYLEKGDSATAKISIDELGKLDQLNPTYKYLFGYYYFQINVKDMAKTELERAIDLDLNGDITEKAKTLLAKIAD